MSTNRRCEPAESTVSRGVAALAVHLYEPLVSVAHTGGRAALAVPCSARRGEETSVWLLATWLLSGR